MTDQGTQGSDGARSDRRARGLAKMAEVYGWDVSDGDGDFFGMTVEHLFAEVWDRPGLSLRDRRLLLIGLLVGGGLDDVVELQMDAALRVGDLTLEDLREIQLFLTHYAGWPRGAKLNSMVDKLASRQG